MITIVIKIRTKMIVKDFQEKKKNKKLRKLKKNNHLTQSINNCIVQIATIMIVYCQSLILKIKNKTLLFVNVGIKNVKINIFVQNV